MHANNMHYFSSLPVQTLFQKEVLKRFDELQNQVVAIAKAVSQLSGTVGNHQPVETCEKVQSYTIT